MAVLFVAFAALGVQVLRNRDEAGEGQPIHPLPVPVHALPVVAQPAPQVAVVQPTAPAVPQPSAAPPMCWTCGNPSVVDGRMPGCGARYHAEVVGGCGAPSIEVCVNCGDPSSAFVKA